MIPAKGKAFRWSDCRYRLVSLLEIMKEFDPGFLLVISRVLQSDELNAVLVVTAPVGIVASGRRTEILNALERECVELELDASLASIRKLQRLLSSRCTKKQLSELAAEISSRLKDELQARRFYALSLAEIKHYNEPFAGWEEIIKRFPETMGDIEEARKSFALSRYAASVFHCVQVIERGLLELGKFLGVRDPTSGFTAVSNELDRILKKSYSERTAPEKRHSAYLEQMQATTEALKDAWRNKISHAQSRLVLLTADFTPHVAEEVMFATRAFMRRLATEMPTGTL